MKKINKKMKIAEILENPKIVAELLKKGMNCVGCPMASCETLELGAIVHGIDPDKLVEELNKIQETEK